MKKTSLILSIASLLTLFSCKKSDGTLSNTSSTQTSEKDESYIIFDSDNFTKPNSSITSLRILNEPKAPIEIGKFKEANIFLEVNYINEESETYLLDEDFFKGDSINLISTPGKKHATILFKRNRISFDFEMIEPKSPVYYKVTFKNFYGNIAFEDIVPYLQDAKYDGYTLDEEIQGNYVYHFTNKWSKDITRVHQNMTVDPIYDKKPIIYRHEYLSFYPNMPFQYKYNNGSDHYVFYLGRVYNYKLATSDIYSHFSQIGQEMSFKVDELSQTYGKFFLPVFKNSIDQGYYYKKDVASGTLTGEENFFFNENNFSDNQIEESSNANAKFMTSLSNMPADYKGYQYPLDKSYSTYEALNVSYPKLRRKYYEQELKEYIYPNDEEGYYRMTLACQSDCYIDITASKESSGFNVSSVRFGIFPRVETTEVIKQHSLKEDFSDEYHYPITLSTSVIYSSLNYAYNKA